MPKTKPPYLSPVQYEAVAMAAYHSAYGFLRMDGGWWTLPHLALGAPFLEHRSGVPVPLWRATAQTIKGFARRGFVVIDGDKAVLQPDALDLLTEIEKPLMPTEAQFMRNASSSLKLVRCGDVHGFWFWESGSNGGLGQLGHDPCYPPMIVASLMNRGWLVEWVPAHENEGPPKTWLTGEGCKRVDADKGRW